jgi:hypothetical protein
LVHILPTFRLSLHITGPPGILVVIAQQPHIGSAMEFYLEVAVVGFGHAKGKP